MSTLSATNLKNASAGSNNIVLNTDGSIGGTCLTQTCRAWVNFNGTGTVAIRASYNVSSITDVNVGDYTVNFTTALADANYSAVITAENTAASGVVSSSLRAASQATGSVGVRSWTSAAALADNASMNVAIFR